MGECVCVDEGGGGWMREGVGECVCVCGWVREMCLLCEGLRSRTVEAVVVDLITEWIEMAAFR